MYHNFNSAFHSILFDLCCAFVHHHISFSCLCDRQWLLCKWQTFGYSWSEQKKKVCRKLDILTCFICIVLGIALGSLSTLFYLSYHSGPLNESCWTDWSSGGVHLHSLPPKADLRLQDTDIGTFCTLGVKITPLRLQRYTVYHMEYRPGDVNRVTDTDDWYLSAIWTHVPLYMEVGRGYLSPREFSLKLST